MDISAEMPVSQITMENETPSQATIDLKGKRGKAHRPKSSSHSNKSLSLSNEEVSPWPRKNNSNHTGKEQLDNVDMTDDIEGDENGGRNHRGSHKEAQTSRPNRTDEVDKNQLRRNSTWLDEGGSLSSGSNVSLGLTSRCSPDSIAMGEGSSRSVGGLSPETKVPSIWQKLKGLLGSRSSSVGSLSTGHRSSTSVSLSPNGSKTPEELFHKHSCRSVESSEFNNDAAERRRQIIQDMVKNTNILAEKQFDEMKVQKEKEKREQEERQRKLLELRKVQAVKGILDGTEHERRMYALQYYFDQDKKHQGFLMTSFCKLLLRHPKTRPLLKEYIQQQKANLGLTSSMDRDDVVKVIAQKWMKETQLEPQTLQISREKEDKKQMESKSENVLQNETESRNLKVQDHMIEKSSNEKLGKRQSQSEFKRDTDKESESVNICENERVEKSQSQSETKDSARTASDTEINTGNNSQNETKDSLKIENETKPRENDKDKAKSATEKLLLEQKIKARLNKRLRRKDTKDLSATDVGTGVATQAKVAGYPRSEDMLKDVGDDMQGTITKAGSIEDKNLAKYVKSLEDVVDEKLKTILT